MTNATMRDLVILWKFHKLLGAAGVLGEHAADRTSGIFHKWHISHTRVRRCLTMSLRSIG